MMEKKTEQAYKNCPKRSLIVAILDATRFGSLRQRHIMNTYSSVFRPWLIYYHAYFRSIITIG